MNKKIGKKNKKKNGWIISNLLYVLVCSIAEYFYTLFVFWLTLWAYPKKGTICKNTQQYYPSKKIVS